MKKTLFALTALALMGGQAFADKIYNHLEGVQTKMGSRYYGEFSSSASVSGGNVVVTEGTDVDPSDVLYVYGGCTENGFADNNSVEMLGGTVAQLIGGQGPKGAKGNTVAVTGGTILDSVFGCRGDYGNASDNTVIISGGSVSKDVVGARGQEVSNNAVHLVGAGATATINGEQYTGQGSGITIGNCVMGAWSTGGARKNNSVNLYGNSITAKALTGYDHLNFFLTNSEATVLTLKDTRSDPFSLAAVELGFTILDETFAVESIVLAEVLKGKISLSDEQLAETWNVTNAKGEVAYQGKLSLNEEHTALTMNFTAVPEPATATLSLLALAALAARRKRK